MSSQLRAGIVVPHIFMQQSILPHVIFSPGQLALSLCDGLQKQGIDVTLFSPGPVKTSATNINADLSYFEQELERRGDSYIDLLKKHPLTFISMARQVQAELIAKAYGMANDNKLDVIHIYSNEEDTALHFASLCKKPVVFTHHDPFNFLVSYKSVFPKYKNLNWLSMSLSQRLDMPADTNWLANIYHGLDENAFTPTQSPSSDYVAYVGRIIEPKGVHLAIAAVEAYNKTTAKKLTLKIAGKHYASAQKKSYWQTSIKPHLTSPYIQYVGYIGEQAQMNAFMANASAIIIPSLFREPFGMVAIEALASGTPIIALDSGALPEIIQDGINGILVTNMRDDHRTTLGLAAALANIDQLDRKACRASFETRFTLDRMCSEHAEVYRSLVTK